jgi:hypothetical protein
MNPDDAANRNKRWIVIIIVALMAVDLVVVISERQWLNAFLILTITLLILLVTVFSDRLAV